MRGTCGGISDNDVHAAHPSMLEKLSATHLTSFNVAKIRSNLVRQTCKK